MDTTKKTDKELQTFLLEKILSTKYKNIRTIQSEMKISDNTSESTQLIKNLTILRLDRKIIQSECAIDCDNKIECFFCDYSYILNPNQ
jgi:hypothetical protein